MLHWPAGLACSSFCLPAVCHAANGHIICLSQLRLDYKPLVLHFSLRQQNFSTHMFDTFCCTVSCRLSRSIYTEWLCCTSRYDSTLSNNKMTAVHKRALHDSAMLLCGDLALRIYNLRPCLPEREMRGEEQEKRKWLLQRLDESRCYPPHGRRPGHPFTLFTRKLYHYFISRHSIYSPPQLKRTTNAIVLVICCYTSYLRCTTTCIRIVDSFFHALLPQDAVITKLISQQSRSLQEESGEFRGYRWNSMQFMKSLK